MKSLYYNLILKWFFNTVLLLIFGTFHLHSAEHVDGPYAGIKMGFEVEVVNPIKYKRTEGEKGLRHKKLLIAKDSTSNEILWRLEVDSSNCDIEFVSVPFSLPDEYEKLKSSSQSIQLILNKLQTIVRPRETFIIDADFLAELNEHLTTIGVIVGFDEKRTSPIPLVVTVNSEIGLPIEIRPQITYQLPLELISNFFTTLGSKERFFEEKHDEKAKFMKDFRDEEKPLDGLFNLIHYYLNNITLLQTHYGTTEVLKKKLKESGVKQLFPIMSRLAFSDMREFLGYSANIAWQRFVTSLGEVLDKPLLPFDYPIMKNPLYVPAKPYDIHAKAKPFGYPYYLLYSDIAAGDENIAFTVRDWLESIQDPESQTRPFLLKSLYGAPRKAEIKAKVQHRYKIIHTLGEDDEGYVPGIKRILKTYLKDMSSPEGSELHEWKDILSPPPYSSFSDSMGTLGDFGRKAGGKTKIDTNYGHAILEVRRYAKYYNSVHRTAKNLHTFLMDETNAIALALIRENSNLFKKSALTTLSRLDI